MEYPNMDCILGALTAGFSIGCIWCMWCAERQCYLLPKKDWQPTASHRAGPEHDQHDVCDQYTRKE